MPPSKGPAGRGYTLQAQEQGTGTTPPPVRGLTGHAKPLPLGRRGGGLGRAAVGPGLWAAQPGALGAGGSPRGSATPPLCGEGDCSGRTVDVTVHPARGPPRPGWGEPVGKASGGSGSQDGTCGTGGRAPRQLHLRCCSRTTSGGVLARAPSCHPQGTESTGVQLVPDRFSSVLRGKCFLPVLYFTSCCLLVGGSSFHTRPQTWRLLPFSPRCYFPGD